MIESCPASCISRRGPAERPPSAQSQLRGQGVCEALVVPFAVVELRGDPQEAVRVILESESEYAALVGADAYRSFTRALAALFQGLGLPTHADPALTARASQSVGVLPLISVRIQRELMEATIARLIYPAGFYRRKAHQIREISKLLARDGGGVPETIDALLELPGVGRKTANLVVTLGFGKLRFDLSDRCPGGRYARLGFCHRRVS